MPSAAFPEGTTVVDPTEWVRGMLGALEDERAQRRRPEGAERLIVEGGVRIPCAEGHLYEFRVPETNRVPGLASADLLIGDRARLNPVLVESWPAPGILRVWAEADLGPRPGDGELLCQADYVLHMLERRVSELGSVLVDRIDALYGSDWPDGRPSGLSEVPIPDLSILNLEQAEAVCAALNAPVARIWGPPGTGKTATAGVLAAAWVRAGRRVLLGGPTHRSTDLLLAAVLERLAWEPADVDGQIVRLGDMSAGPFRERWGEILSVHALRARRSREAEESLPRARSEVRELRRALQDISNGPGRPDYESRLECKLERLRDLEAKAETTSADLVARAQVVATTAHRIALGQVPRGDMVLLDEGSMVSLPVGLLASLYAPHLITVGDPRQLGPVVQAQSRRARRWVGSSLFDDARTSGGGLPRMKGPLSLLTRQYRMPPAVCRVVSAFAYDGELRSAPLAAQQDEAIASAGEELGGLFYLCASHGQSPRPSSRPSLPRANPGQADLVMSILSRFLQEDPALRGRTAVISPYRAHVAALKRAAKAQGLGSALQVSTVHRAQGHEYRFVVLSIPERWGERLSPFLRARSVTDDGGRLLTVAVSRASERLLVVGHLPWLIKAAPNQGALRRMLKLIMQWGEPLERSWAHSKSPDSTDPGAP
jgi:hypothetical protein